MPAYIPIDEAIAACRAAGNNFPPGLKPIQSDLKRETSLIGQAYLNYIYQNDIGNQHFCQAMLLMYAQVPKATPNSYVALFEARHAVATLAALADVQLCFDYAIARTDPPLAKVESSVATLQAIVK
jgi:hypothetical protein